MENNVVGLIVLWKQMINNILIPLTPSRHHFQLWLLVSGFKWTDENQLRHLQSWSFTFCGSDSPSSAAAAAAASFSSISFSTWWKEKEKLPPDEKKKASISFMVFNSHHFSSLPCHSWLKPLVEDKSRAEQKDWLKPQKLLWVEKLSPHFPILSLPWLTWEAARFERTSRWFRTPWFEGIKSVFKVSSRLNGDKSYLGLGGSFSVAELVLSLWCSFLLEMFTSCKVGFDKTLPNLILLPVLPGVNRFLIRARFCSTGNCIKIWGVVSHAPL